MDVWFLPWFALCIDRTFGNDDDNDLHNNHSDDDDNDTHNNHDDNDNDLHSNHDDNDLDVAR